MAIHLGRPLPDASRDRPEQRREGPPGTPANRRCLPLLLGLAPGGVYPAAAVAGGAVRSYRTISPLPPMPSHAGPPGIGGVFLWHFPWGCPRRALPGTVPPWSPDFPPSSYLWRAAIRPSGMGRYGPPPAEIKAGAALRPCQAGSYRPPIKGRLTPWRGNSQTPAPPGFRSAPILASIR